MAEPQPFVKLADEFNAAADSWVNGPLAANALVTRYALLMRHCAEDDEQKRQLTSTLFKATVTMLEKVLKNTSGLNPGYKNHMAIPLDAMAHPSAIGYLPMQAARELAGVGLAVLTHVEKITLDATDKVPFHDFAAMLLGYADTYGAAIAKRTYETATSQPIAAARPISLKQKSDTPP